MPSAPVPFPGARLQSIDALRGLVILCMLLDHVRETFYLHRQVGDPMDVACTEPALFFSRLLAHVCAPVFVFLTGLSACLYGARQPDARAAAAGFLARRGLVLVVLVAGHNLLDGLHFAPGHALHVPWAVLHDRGWIAVGDGLRLRTSYPLLPWIGVIALGYAAGPWFQQGTAAAVRQRRLWAWGLALLVGFVALRALNAYGEAPWTAGTTPLRTAMGFLNVTKYPPSLLFLMLTLGTGLLVLWRLERPPGGRWLGVLAVFGAAPLFFYLLHLYVLRLMYLAAEGLWGANQGRYFGFDGMAAVWLCSVLLSLALYGPVRAFGRFKARRKDIAWLKYL